MNCYVCNTFMQQIIEDYYPTCSEYCDNIFKTEFLNYDIKKYKNIENINNNIIFDINNLPNHFNEMKL